MNFLSNNNYLKDYNEDSTDHIRSTGLNQSSSKLQLRVITTVLQQYNSIYISIVLTQYNFIINKYILYH